MLRSFFCPPSSERVLGGEPTSTGRQTDGTHNRLNGAIRTSEIECRMWVGSGRSEGMERRPVQDAVERLLSARSES